MSREKEAFPFSLRDAIARREQINDFSRCKVIYLLPCACVLTEYPPFFRAVSTAADRACGTKQAYPLASKSVTVRQDRPLPLRSLREPRFYPQKYGAFSANSVNVVSTLSCKKKSLRTHATNNSIRSRRQASKRIRNEQQNW